MLPHRPGLWSLLLTSLVTSLAGTLAGTVSTGCGGSVGHVTGTGDDAGPTGPIGDDELPPGYDASPVNPQCTGLQPLAEGEPCNVANLVCPSGATVIDCSGLTHALECVCDGQSWSCESSNSPGCAELAPCPDPGSVVPGGECNVPSSQECMGTQSGPIDCYNGPVGTIQVPCTCNQGSWSCEEPDVPQCIYPIPSETCPSPYEVSEYATCNVDPSLTCSGNPQSCGGQIFYDAFECEGSWVPIARTTCDVYPGLDDGGYPYSVDASTAAYVVDSGVVSVRYQDAEVQGTVDASVAEGLEGGREAGL